MTAVLAPRGISFPHDILHSNMDTSAKTSQRPSLPSISSLILDIDRKTALGKTLASCRRALLTFPAPLRSPGFNPKRTSGEYRLAPPTPDRASFASTPRSTMPPTPPLPGASSFDFSVRDLSQSPATSTAGRNSYFPHSPSALSLDTPDSKTPTWHGLRTPVSSRRPSDELDSPMSDAHEERLGMMNQRPLPANFPPTIQSQDQILSGQYQHHHHYSGSPPDTFPQTVDRYQCPTCSKAFSRPSSLKIHTYSHTGEKPFKCKHEGCGKFFSVRSNMKRHEKGCHGAGSASADDDSSKEE